MGITSSGRGGEDGGGDESLGSFGEDGEGKILCSAQMSEVDGSIEAFFDDDGIGAADGDGLGFIELVELIFEAEGEVVHDGAFGLD